MIEAKRSPSVSIKLSGISNKLSLNIAWGQGLNVIVDHEATRPKIGVKTMLVGHSSRQRLRGTRNASRGGPDRKCDPDRCQS